MESYWLDLLEPVAEAWDEYLLSVLPKIERIKSPPEVLSLALEESIYRTIIISWLMGRMHVQESAPRSMNFRDEIPDEIELPHEEAIEYLKSRTSMSRDAFYDLEAAGRFRAFTVAKVSSMDAIEETKKRLLASLAEGQSMAQFIQSARASEVIQKGGFSKSTPWYWETVFRTNSIAAWNGGRFQQYKEVFDSIQDLQYISILDRRTSDICRSYNGITRPATDTIWERITPPNHFNCRSTVTAIWKGTREAKRITRSSDEDVAALPMPDDGFESSIVDVKDYMIVPKSILDKSMKQGTDDEIQNAKRSYQAMMNEGGEGYNPYQVNNAPPMDRREIMLKLTDQMNATNMTDPKWAELKQKWETLFLEEWDIETTKARRELWNSWVLAEKKAGRKIPNELKVKKEKAFGFTFKELKTAIGLHGL